MVRSMKLLLPYAKLSFIGWVVWASNAPQWQTVFALLLLAWLAVGITALRVAFAAVARGFLAQSDTTKLLGKLLDCVDEEPPGFSSVTKPRRRFL